MNESSPPSPEPSNPVTENMDGAGIAESQPTGPADTAQGIRKAILAGLCVTLVTSAIWAVLVISTDLKLGFLAWILGIAVGTTMVTVARSGSLRLGVAALLLTATGLGVTKGLTYQFHLVPLYHAEIEDNADIRKSLAALDFRERFYLEDLDLLWVFLALASAWQLASGRKGG